MQKFCNLTAPELRVMAALFAQVASNHLGLIMCLHMMSENELVRYLESVGLYTGQTFISQINI